ncbi:diacylglycerol kinase [Streptomyces orinoci]|uniref:Diacylglycerol kinase n=1 Tax=Streptomyces orinoci TaxID=67339 RepID=A0ABV3K1D8_STRON|nr:diacylglycerol kinase [Streptomyces orinoci]
MSAADPTGRQLLVVIDPVARRMDGESVRIARDVLCGGAAAKICLPNGPQETVRAVARRGRRRIVMIGDDRALLRVVGWLHRQRELDGTPLAWVPVGPPEAVSVARALGVPLGAVAAARAVLEGTERRLGLLADDGDGVVLGGLWVPAGSSAPYGPALPAPARPWWRPTARGALALLSRPTVRYRARTGSAELRVVADGVLLAEPGQAVGRVAVSAVEGLAEVEVHPLGVEDPLRCRARSVTVSGPGFRYRADNHARGPVRVRTWTAVPEGWRLVLPGAP